MTFAVFASWRESILLSCLGDHVVYRCQCLVGDLKDRVDPFVGRLGGRVGRDAYITKYRPAYPATKFINENLSQNAKIVGIFMGNRRYYCNRDLVLNDSLLGNLVINATSPQMIYSRLAKRGFTHLLIRFDLFNQWTENNFRGEQKKKLSSFFNSNTLLLVSKGGYGLFELTPSPNAGAQ